MKAKGFELAWITVKDIDQAIQFYTEVVGLTLQEYQKEFKWAELSGSEGARIGLAQAETCSSTPSDKNAIMTISVEDMQKAQSHFLQKGAQLVGNLIEIPGKIKMQTFVDPDGHTLQLVQTLNDE